MYPIIISLAIFAVLSLCALATMGLHHKIPDRHRNEETTATVRLIANLFVVMASLVFGLMINSSKNTFEVIDGNVHAFVTDIVVLDRSLRNYGSGAAESRKKLEGYLLEAIRNPTRGNDHLGLKPDTTGHLLDALGHTLAKIDPSTNYQTSLIMDIRQQYHRIVEQRWALIEQSEGNIPAPIIGMLTAWLALIFATYGYRAPANPVTVGMVLISAALIGASIYLVLDMCVPFSGPIRVSDMPLQRALAEMQRDF